MGRHALFSWSLRRTVLTLLLPTLAVISGLELFITYRTATDAANSAYDRSLLGAIKAIDANISTPGGGLAVETPYTLFEFFELTASGQVFFRVATEDRLVEIGSADLPVPPLALQTRKPQFYDAVYFGEKVRVGAYARVLDKPFGSAGGASERVVIQVAETLTSRQEFIGRLLRQALQRDLVLLLLAGAMLAIVLFLTLQPLARLRDAVGARSDEDMTPIDTESVPVDVRPLVAAINLHMARNRQFMESRRRFVDDASHQLRTPLATLRTQLDYALRETDMGNVRDALDAISRQLDDATHGTNQMLALAKADAAGLVMAEVDLDQLAEQAARDVVLAAREKRIDLEYSGPDTALAIRGHAGLLREAAINLLQNAIRYAPEHGQVTLTLRREQDEVLLTVADNGPGVPADQLAQLGQRFFRARNSAPGGSGLGLAIARAVAERHGGGLRAANLPGADGFCAALVLPAAGVSGAAAG
ncbi:MAG: sensor histidine kinase N-terminal domain-containing protein [Noviherbaspirillum sp.]